jgi:hypothetical protein
METVRRDPVLRPIGLNYRANVRKLSTRRVAAVAHVNASESVARIEQTNVREAASVGGLSIFLCDVVMSAIGPKPTSLVAPHVFFLGQSRLDLLRKSAFAVAVGGEADWVGPKRTLVTLIDPP